MARLIDISPPLTPRTAVWPGDVRFSRQVACAISGGSNIDLSAVTTTVHIGAHTDAPSHYRGDGAGIGERPLDYYYGACQVMTVDVARHARVLPSHLIGPIRAPRLLLHTGTQPDPDVFNEDFAALSPELVEVAHAAGVVLLGVDTPSIDPFASKALETHQAIADRDMAVLEGVVLDGVPDGIYTLIALPLRMPGVDASPVRAVLVGD